MPTEDELRHAKALRDWEIHLLQLCNCAYPMKRYRDGSGHHPDCPTHAQWRTHIDGEACE